MVLSGMSNRPPLRFRDRYPAPWQVVELPGGYEVRCVKADTRLVIVYEGARSSPGMSRAEARALATAIASLGGAGGDAIQPCKDSPKQDSEK